MIILDTNVITELQKPQPNQGVLDWLDAQEPTNLYLTSITAAELTHGVCLLPEGARARQLTEAVQHILEVEFKGRILPFEAIAAERYGMIMAEMKRSGISMGICDAQIAAISVAHYCSPIATRNVKPFKAVQLKVVNPFT